MVLIPWQPEELAALDECLGYLNLSSGSPDPRFAANFNRLYARLEKAPISGQKPWESLREGALVRLAELRSSRPAFASSDQAAAVLRIGLGPLLTLYRQFHRDLLAHQSDADLFRPFFLVRALEATLLQGGDWREVDRITEGALGELNDFIGYRPVAVLHSQQRIQPYRNEWVRPIPLYLRGAGIACGRYARLVERTLEALRTTDRRLLEASCLDLDLLDELAFDPRAFDFDHPANKRPSYSFGQWDPHEIDGQGRYRRFVLVQVTMDGMLARVDEGRDGSPEELLEEAAFVLAGTMLMAAGVSGRGPGHHSSLVTLGNLVPRIAALRDEFYEQRLQKAVGAHAERLRREARLRKQAFGGARQDLNQRLARLRSSQMQRVQLAYLFARLGAGDAAGRQLEMVHVTAARMQSEIMCRVASANSALARGDFGPALAELPQIEDLLQRAIGCGALVDPWNILGFGGNFSLFPAPENSVHDHRVDDLLQRMEDIFGLYARSLSEAAAQGAQAVSAQLRERMGALAEWWDGFGATTIGDLEAVRGGEACESAAQVAEALAAWREAGEAAGAVGFWREKMAQFRSPRSYSLVVEALLEKRDFVASMALLLHWVGQVREIPLEEGGHSFHDLAARWLRLALHAETRVSETERWALARKFLDYLEANAEEYWTVPQFEFQSATRRAAPEPGQEEDEEEADNLFSAAYEEMTYRDTTADGIEGSLAEGGGGEPSDTELDFEATRIGRRLSLLGTAAQLWRLAAVASLGADSADGERRATLAAWRQRASDNLRQLRSLMEAVQEHPIPAPTASRDSLVDYDRRMGLKLSLLEKIVSTGMMTATAAHHLAAAAGGELAPDAADWEPLYVSVLPRLFRGTPEEARLLLPELFKSLRRQPLLYVALARGGNAEHNLTARVVQQVCGELLERLPRRGLLREAGAVLEFAQDAERRHGLPSGAVTEFDRLFQLGYAALVDSLVASSATWQLPDGQADDELFDALKVATNNVLPTWNAHSRSVRLSSLEPLQDEMNWRRIKKFIEKYGQDLLAPSFFNPANLRAIRHQGAEVFFERLLAHPEPEQDFALLSDLGRGISLEEAAEHLTQIIDAVLENQEECVDFKMTTTHSDRGEMFYVLLDFLRLKASYVRIAHSLKPAAVAHDILVTRGRAAAAELWRNDLVQETAEVAARHLKKFQDLARKHGTRLPTVADVLGEKFVRPLLLDRVRALIRPAVDELRRGAAGEAVAALEREINEFARTPSGGGVSVPDWIVALEDEVDQIEERRGLPDQRESEDEPPRLSLSQEQLFQQLHDWAHRE